MSQQGEPSRHDEDEWWQQLYGPAGRGAPLPPPHPRAGSADDHSAAVRTVMDGRPGGGGASGSGPAAVPDAPDAPAGPVGTGGPDTPIASGAPAVPGALNTSGVPRDPRGPGGSGAPGASGAETGPGAGARDAAVPGERDAPTVPGVSFAPCPSGTCGPPEVPDAPGSEVPTVPAMAVAPGPGAPWSDAAGPDASGPCTGSGPAAPDTPGAGAFGTSGPDAPGPAPETRGVASPGGTQPPDTLRLRPLARGSAGPGPVQGPRRTAPPAASGPLPPPPPRAATEFPAPGSPPSGPRPTAEDIPDGPPAHVGERPPTYAPEPTAWPPADPGDLDSLTPDTVLDGGRHGVLTVRAVSVRGDSARHRGHPRRDALFTARFGEGDSALLLLAVAGGGRACEHSHRAATEVCRWIVSSVGASSASLADDIRRARRGTLKSGLHRLTDRAAGRLRARAAELGQDPGEYTAALRCLLLPADPGCRTRVFFGVGEGGLFRLRDGEWQDLDPRRDPEPSPAPGFGPAPVFGPGDTAPGVLAGAGAGGGAGAGSAAVPGADAGAPAPRFRFRASVGRPGDVLLLCTEGMSEPLRGEPALAGLLAERWADPERPPGLAPFLRDIQVRATGYADDRTAVAAWEA